MSTFWLVEAHSVFAEPAPHDLAMHAIRTLRIDGYPGDVVKSVSDLRGITLETLATLLMSDAEFAEGMRLLNHKRDHTSFNLIRAYWKRVRQPRLLG